MKHICVTNIDATTGALCTEAPMSTGPSFPNVDGLSIEWSNESQWPIECNSDGVYQTPPLYFGLCDDSVEIPIVGVLEFLTELDYNTRKRAEFFSRKPFDSWIFDESTLMWNPPIAVPTDDKVYQWNEAATAWVEVTQHTTVI